MSKKLVLILLFNFLAFISFSQIDRIDSLKNNNVIYNKINQEEAVWDNGIPILPDDDRIMNLIYQLNQEAINDPNKLTKEQVRIYRELGVEFYNKGMYQEADFYLSKIKNYTETKHVQLKDVFNDNPKEIREEIKKELDKEYQDKLNSIKEEPKEELSKEETQSIKKDSDFIKSLPQKFENISKEDLEQLSKQIENRIRKLTKERDDLIKNNGSQELIDSKNTNINSLKKEKQVIDLSIDKEQLKEEKTVIKRWLWVTLIVVLILGLSILALLQRKTIKIQDSEIEKQLIDLKKKNTYLEHAARIIRHDMHSGINTYIPRGITSLEKRITEEEAKNLKIEAPIKMIKEGLNHTQKVYKSVYEFTNLVKQNSVLDKKEYDLKDLITDYLKNTAYSNQVIVEDLIKLEVNGVLFCNAVDNLIKNGLKYNESSNKLVKIYMEGKDLIVQDNGKGLTQKEFEKICYSYVKKKDKELDEEPKGLGLNISLTILKEHGFDLTCEKNEIGTKMKIKIKND